MDDLGVMFWLIVLVFSILNIILFFKIWAMTSDVNSIKRILQGETVSKEAEDDSSNTVIGVLVGIFIIFGIILLAS